MSCVTHYSFDCSFVPLGLPCAGRSPSPPSPRDDPHNLSPQCPTAPYHVIMWYSPSTRSSAYFTRVPSFGQTLLIQFGPCQNFLPEVREFIQDTRPKTNTTRGGRKGTALLLRLGLYTPPSSRTFLPRRRPIGFAAKSNPLYVLGASATDCLPAAARESNRLSDGERKGKRPIRSRPCL